MVGLLSEGRKQRRSRDERGANGKEDGAQETKERPRYVSPLSRNGGRREKPKGEFA